MKNLIETKLTAADKAAVDEAIETLETIFEGKLRDLTEEERVRYGSINEQNKLLVNKVRDLQQSDANLASPDVNWTQFESDYQERLFLETRSSRLGNLAYKMQSTKILHDHDNYQDALSDYAYSQYKKGSGDSDYKNKTDELKAFFNRWVKVRRKQVKMKNSLSF